MFSDLQLLSFEKIIIKARLTTIVLGTEEKQFAIYTESVVGNALQKHMMGMDKPRPLTHDLMGAIFRGCGIHLLQVVINDVQDTVYFCRLFLEQEEGEVRHIVEVDARPSDCITLAVLYNIPVYCTREVLDKVVPFEE